MNNDQFRRLVLNASGGDGNATSKGGSDTKSRTLGGRGHSSIHMTPRSVLSSTHSFARQAQDGSSGPPPLKKFKHSAAPKGTKLAPGYRDRVLDRQGEGVEDEKTKRVEALEEMVKLGRIDEATFEKLKDEMGVGGDIQSTHLVKGLDFKLLERVKRGEDVLNSTPANEHEQAEVEDMDDALDELEKKEVEPVVKEQKEKHGQRAPPPPGQKRTRDDILAELRASRRAAAKPTLGPKFRRVGEPKVPERRIEIDERGREVMIVTDEHGNVKRKVRKTDKGTRKTEDKGLLVPDKLRLLDGGFQAPIVEKSTEEEEEDGDIFDGVGDDYDPLAGIEDSSSSDEEESEKQAQSKNKRETKATSPPKEQQSESSHQPRNYFASTTISTSADDSKSSDPLHDPTILAALKKASSALQQHARENLPETRGSGSAAAPNTSERLKQLIEAQDRDAADMDLGFGSSRVGDDEEIQERGVKLSTWGETELAGDASGSRGGKKRKRGPKKKKMNGDSARDVLQVLEQRKARQT